MASKVLNAADAKHLELLDMFWPLMSWGRYLAFSDILRDRLDGAIVLPKDVQTTKDDLPPPRSVLQSKHSNHLLKDATFVYYHSSLLPVVEGWKQLKFADERIALLLEHRGGFVGTLRQHRNAIFHYQSQFLGPKERGIYEKDQFVLWAFVLHREFERYFRQTIDRWPCAPDQRIAFKQEVVDILGWMPITLEDKLTEIADRRAYIDTQLERSDLSQEASCLLLEMRAAVEKLPDLAIESFSKVESLKEKWFLSIVQS